MPKRTFDFVHLDVFTNRPLEGNPLAVFPDACGLSDGEMQQLAREMNLSETTFILPRDRQTEGGEGVRVRIFTVQEELPFAGHPTLGTAWLIKQLRPGENEVLLDLNVGKVPVRFEHRDADIFGEMRQIDPTFADVHPREAVAGALGISVDELDDSLPVQTVSTGLPFTMVLFRRLSTLAELNVSWSRMSAYLSGYGQPGFFYLAARDGDAANKLRARMIFYNGEDPATGSAAGCCAAWAVKYGLFPSDQECVIEQGREVRRPSYLFVRGTRDHDRVVNVRVGGNVVRVIDGRVTL